MTLNLNSKTKLNNGVEIPILGLGVYQSPPGETTVQTVRYALNIGYRHIDTARIYGNEEDVGRAIRESGISREEIFVTTKVWNSDQGYHPTLKALENSLRRLGLSYVDLYLIHWPVQGKIIETWKALIDILKDNKSRSIGVSNYSIYEINETVLSSNIIPSVNQIEVHPFLYQKDILQFCKDNNIQVESYSPLTRGIRLTDSTITKIAKKYNKTSAQILIRWSIQHGLVVIPKSVHRNRILENSQIFDFNIGKEDMNQLDSLNENLRTVFL
jgi:diketogulonate reductase-like aldo/keto reductase